MAEKEKRDANVHRGHRARVRAKYLKVGMQGFSEHEIIEFLLYYCNAQQDTNEVAHRLINEFGSLGGVFSAAIEDLVKVKGIGEQSAFLIKFISDLMKLQIGEFDKRVSLDTTEKIGDYMMPFFEGSGVEMTFIMALNEEKKVIRVIKVAEGSFDSVALCIPKITRQLVSCGAFFAVVVHNHPRGIALPSVKDIRTTKQIQLALSSVGVEFVDHIVISKDKDYISMRDSGGRLYTVAAEQ